MRIGDVVRNVSAAVTLGMLTSCLAGCDSGPKENPKSIGVVNPDPNNPLKDVTLENEAQNLDRIKAGTDYKAPAK